MPRLTDKQKAVFTRKNYAHRGLYTPDGVVPENSLAAFRRARERGYGIELDVQLTKDSRVVVFHDDDLKRMTGREGNVWDFTFAELQALTLGATRERIPLFSDVLALIRGGGPLIVEIKNGPHNDELCEKTYALLKDYGGDYCIESFNPMIVRWFMRHAPEVVRGQLSASYGVIKQSVGNAALSFALCQCLFTPLNKPDFIAYKIGPRPLRVKLMRRAGMLLFGWTPHEPPLPEENDGVIFEFYEPDTTF